MSADMPACGLSLFQDIIWMTLHLIKRYRLKVKGPPKCAYFVPQPALYEYLINTYVLGILRAGARMNYYSIFHKPTLLRFPNIHGFGKISRLIELVIDTLLTLEYTGARLYGPRI